MLGMSACNSRVVLSSHCSRFHGQVPHRHAREAHHLVYPPAAQAAHSRAFHLLVTTASDQPGISMGLPNALR